MSFEPGGSVTVEGVRYQAFHLLPRSTEAASGRHFVEVIGPASLRFYSDKEGSQYFVPLLNDYFGSCVRSKTRPSTVFVREEWESALNTLLGSRAGSGDDVDGVATGVRLASGRYTIKVVGASEPLLFRMKLNYFPGFHLRDSRGQELPIFEGLSGMIAYGTGEFSLEYERPPSFYFAYVLSFCAASFLGASWLRGRRSFYHTGSLRES